MIDIVNAILFREGDILLAKRSPNRKAYPDKWSLPGGHVEPGETLEAALVREIQEELAVLPSEYSMLGKIDDPNFQRSEAVRYHVFEVTEWGKAEPEIDDNEHTDLMWLPLSKAYLIRGLALSEYRLMFDKLAVKEGLPTA